MDLIVGSKAGDDLERSRSALGDGLAMQDMAGDHQISRLHIKIMILAFVGMVVDGYDLTVAGFAAPSIIKAWQVSPKTIGIILSASLLGVLVGSFAFGWFGDKFGRKPALVWANLLLGGATLAAVFSTTPTELAVLRALAGIGIGGVIPNLVALVSEFAPPKIRAREVLRMLLGNSVGAGVPGLVSVLLLPLWGWQVYFVVGGLAPLVIAAVYARYLPESVKFLMKSKRFVPGQPSALAVAEPEPAAEFQSAGHGKSRMAQLFVGDLRFVTPLLWVAFVVDLMTYYFIYGWMPFLLGVAGGTTAQAALSTTMFSVGGAVSGLALGSLVDRVGARILPVLFLLAVAMVVSLGSLATSPLLNVVAFGGGFALIGLQYTLNAVAGELYPTNCRSLGVGSALGVGRIGAITGSLGGGLLITAGLSAKAIHALAAIPLTVAALASFLIARRLRKVGV